MFTPAQLSPVPKHRKGDDFEYSFQFVEDDAPLNLSNFDEIKIRLYTGDTVIFEHSTTAEANLSSSDTVTDIVSGVVSGDVMDVGARRYYIDIETFLDGKKRTYVSSPFNVVGSGNSGTANEWLITITNSTDTATGERATNVMALAVQAKVDAESARDEAVTTVNNAIADIESARDSALANIDTSESESITAINTARDNGITAVNNARDEGVTAVESARDSAINDINTLVTQAETARDETQAIKDSIEWKGEFDATTTYAKDNRVSYLGSSFISLQDSNTGNTPSDGSEFWDVIAEKGEQGIQGEQGPQGEKGDTGPQGEKGEDGAIQDIQELGSISGATDINISNGRVVTATLTDAVTLSFSGLPSAGKEISFSLRFTNPEEITWPTGTLFSGGIAPVILGNNYQIECSIQSNGQLFVWGVIDDIGEDI